MRSTRQTLEELLGSAPPAPLAGAGRDLYVHVLLYDDWNEDQVADLEFGAARLGPTTLPAAPWAFSVALATLHGAFNWDIDDFFPEAVAAVRQRWPAETATRSVELDTMLGAHFERRRELDQLATHWVAAAGRDALARRASPTLARDLESVQTWVGASRSRAALRPRARRRTPAPPNQSSMFSRIDWRKGEIVATRTQVRVGARTWNGT